MKSFVKLSNILISNFMAIHTRYFTSLSYSADGKCVLAGGRSKRVCLYHVSQKVSTWLV